MCKLIADETYTIMYAEPEGNDNGFSLRLAWITYLPDQSVFNYSLE